MPIAHAVHLAEAEAAATVGGGTERAEGWPDALARAAVGLVEKNGPVCVAPVGPAHAAAAATWPDDGAQHLVVAELLHLRVEGVDRPADGPHEEADEHGDNAKSDRAARIRAIEALLLLRVIAPRCDVLALWVLALRHAADEKPTRHM